MFETRTKRIALAAAAATAAVTAAVVPMGIANAGHTNALLESDLSGRAEVGPDNRIAGDPNGTGEAYVFGIDGDAKTLCYVLTVDRIGTATAAHIHEAAAGANGPVVANLAAPGDGNAADCLSEGEPGKFVGDQTVADILENPEDYYVNVHTADYPNGALRGQLELQH